MVLELKSQRINMRSSAMSLHKGISIPELEDLLNNAERALKRIIIKDIKHGDPLNLDWLYGLLEGAERAVSVIKTTLHEEGYYERT
jgi:hypothetical protein